MVLCMEEIYISLDEHGGSMARLRNLLLWCDVTERLIYCSLSMSIYINGMLYPLDWLLRLPISTKE